MPDMSCFSIAADIEEKMDSAEASAREGVDVESCCFIGGTAIENDNIMDWETTNEEVADVASAPTAPKIVSEVPVGETGAYAEDLDMETFSFDLEEEDEDDAKLASELSTAFDINVLQTAIEESADALEIVTGKDVVMIAGKTGVGKSTLIQGIAGKRIHEIEHTTSFSGEVATKSAYDAENALPAFEIGHSKKSKTRSINAFVRGIDNHEVVYLDTPGIEDTRGVEMDIATAALLSQVAKRCKSIKFVILIHCASLIEDRGGAFRSVLRFARAYVRDFSESKQSFMFLFTHAGDITGMSESLVDAKKCLLEEIIRTAAGTKDDDVLAVLNFIRACLKKNYPFVQIFHPMDMNYTKLASFIEHKLEKVSDLTLARSPSLTLSAKLKLESAAQSLVQLLRVAFRNTSQDVGQASDIRKTLQSLSDYIDVDCLRHATVESKAIIDEHTEMLQSSISDHVSRGTKSDLEFNEEHIQALKETLLQLRELDSQHSSNHSHQIMEASLLEFANDIATKACSFKSFHKDLKKVSVWAEGFEEFAPIYVRSCTRITEFVHGLSTALSEVDISSLDMLSDEDIGIFIRKLSNVNAMCEQLTQFPDPCIDVEDVVISKNTAMQTLESVFLCWSANAENFAKKSSFIEYEDDLEVIVKHVHALEIIRASMEAALKDYLPNFRRLEECVMTTMKELESQVTGRFNLCCAEMRGKPFDPSWKLQLFWMQAVCNRFDGMKSTCWRQMKSSFYSIIDTIKSDLHRLCGELDNMSNMLTDHSGMINGENFAKEVMFLESCMWVDSCLPSHQKFAAGCSGRVRRIVDARIQKRRAELELIIDNNVPVSGSNSSKLIQDIGRMLPELREIDKYSSILGGIEDEALCGLTSKCVEHLERYVSDLVILAKKCVVYWASNIPNSRIGKMRSITRKLNGILANVESLLATGVSDVVDQKSREIRSDLYDAFTDFDKSVQSEFSSFEGSFGTKTAFLTTIKACNGFSHVESQLTDYTRAQQYVRELISKEAAKIEASIETSSDWDQIDESLVKFGTATALDQFIGGDVSSRLHTLQRLREHKEHQVDDLMESMIRNRDFKGIGEFLAPMANSKDQVKKQKFQSHQAEIASNLKEVMNEIDRLLDSDSALGANSLAVAKKISILVEAHSELRNLLASQLNLAFELQKLRQRMNDILRHFTKQIIQATKEKDFVRLVMNRRQGSNFLSDMRQHLIKREVLNFESASEKSKLEVDLVPRYVDRFFKSRFEDGDDLFKSMKSLKQAKSVGSFHKLTEVYETTKKMIESKVCGEIELVKTAVSESQCYDESILCVHKLHRQLQGELRDHCPSHLVTECERLIQDLRRQKKCNDRVLELDGRGYEQNLEKLSLQLDKLSSNSVWNWLWSQDNTATYKRLCNALLEKVEGRFNQAQVALIARDLVSVQETVEFLEHVHKKAGKHVKVVWSRVQCIRGGCIDAFQKLCDDAKQILSSDNIMPFKEIFPDYRGFVIHIPCILQSSSGLKGFALVNQMLHESLARSVLALMHMAEAEVLESSRLRSQVLHTRSWGNFLADHLTLLQAEVNNTNAQAEPDKWLGNIHKFCWEHFNFGRDLSKIKYCAILGVPPSASKAEINKSFRSMAKRCHPDKNKSNDQGAIDKNKSNDQGAMFRKIKEAQEELLTMNHLIAQIQEQSFDQILIGVGEKLRDRAKSFMYDQRYDMAEKLLFELPNITILDDLVVPKLNSDEIKASVYALMKGLVEQSRVEVDSNWAARNYKDLNIIITNLKNMEQHFKAYPHIFPKSWDSGICRTIEAEIEMLGRKASACLQSLADAKRMQGDFRRCFIQMGFVLIELPSFKSFTKSVMSCVLESCLDSGWGYGYLFELGLSLQKGDDGSSEDESRVAQMIVTEFSHFKEVLVMVWNEEVSQKPAEDLVNLMRGEVHTTSTQIGKLDVDHRQLLDSFMSYEREYKSLVGDYIKPDADLNALVQKTLALARQVTPSNSCNDWGEDLKAKIPVLLAGVFSLLTVVKSGASYNRIEEATGSSDLGEKLLMKPHNIQVLSLLLMLGCGKSGKTSLENQLMQIRTGEGKSMILGAASVMLAMLGFRVRTVCYSEYLSDRDFRLFEDVFERFGLRKYIAYSKITAFAEDATSAKGDIRSLTESLLRGTMLSAPPPPDSSLSVARTISHGRTEAASEATPLVCSPHYRTTRSKISRKSELDTASTRVTAQQQQQQQQHCTLGVTPASTSMMRGVSIEPRRSARTRGGKMEKDNGGAQGSGSQSSDDRTAQLSANYARLSCNTVAGQSDPDHEGSIEYDEATKKRHYVLLSGSVDEVETKTAASVADEREEILLVDEVDVFFGSEFYGQTYNQVVEVREPEIEEILKRIWNAWSQGGRRLKLSDIKSMPEYTRLLDKLSSFSFLVDNEISLMLNQVSKVDDVPYYLDIENDRIGYKVMDSISYDVTYGYSTCFAYLKELSKLKNRATLAKVLAMPVSCGRFSYANISPHRILGVSGTLQALSEYEREILLKYGLKTFTYVPSVYGASNFDFDKAGEGIYFENSKSDFFHRISAEITSSAKGKRAVIVFFRDRAKLDEFVGSPTYRQLSRHKKLLTEDMPTTEKSYVISKAATAGQITLSTAVFGRGTDFFCKDEVVESKGGVHIIQTFLSEELSEEIQIQGRTARQGKRGSFQLVLLESDLESQFGVPVGARDKIPRKDLYDWLCKVRLEKHRERCKLMEENLLEATEKDHATHNYFDHLLAHNITEAKVNFESLYRLMKKPPMPSSLVLDLAFAIDVTGSMAPYLNCVVSTTLSLISGKNSIMEKLKSTFPEIEFKLRVGAVGFRDIDDKHNQFHDIVQKDGGHFTDDVSNALQCIKSLVGNANGGGDIAEDHIAAIHHCSNNWIHTDDWTSDIKCLILFSDAPSHGLAAPLFSGDGSYDSYPTHHPDGLKVNDAISSLLSKDIDLFFCSFDPNATDRTEEELSQSMKNHPENKSERDITRIPMVPRGHLRTTAKSFNGQGRHIIFVLDESGSMVESWSGVVVAYRKYIEKRKQSQSNSDLVSVVQFDDRSRITVAREPLSRAPEQLSQRGGMTYFHPAALDACKLGRETPPSRTPLIIFMSDGAANDASAAAREFSALNDHVIRASSKHLELHVIAFGNGACQAQLQEIACASKVGKVHTSANVADLASVFVSIAANENVATVLESEIAKRMSEAVSDKLSLEYFGS